MQRKSSFRLFIKLVLYYILYNIGCTLLVFAAAVLLHFPAVKILLQIVFIGVFYILVYSTAFKDGERENNMLKFGHIQSIDKYKWTKTGCAVLGIISTGNIALLLSRFGVIPIDILAAYRILNGSVYPLSLIIEKSADISLMPAYEPFVLMLCYIFLPFVSHIAFNFGKKGIYIGNKIMYE